MTKPKKSNSTTKSETSQAETPSEETKKDAADPGVIAHEDIGEGSGASAQETGGEIKPIESTLVGDGGDGLPAAEKRDEREVEATALSEPASDAAAPEDATASDEPSEKVDLTDTPADAILRETPASAPAPVQNVTVNKTGFWPVVLGGVVAAGLGAAATIWALPHLPAGWLPDPAPVIDVDAIRADAVKAAEDAAQKVVADMPAPEAPGDLQAALDEQAKRVEALAQSLENLPAAAEATGEQADAALGQTVADLKTWLQQQASQIEQLTARPQLDEAVAAKIQALADQADTLKEQIEDAAQKAQEQIIAAQDQASKLQEAAADSTRRAEAVAAIASLKAALERGVTKDEAAQALEGSGIDAPEALQRDVPSLASLQAGFGDASRDALRATLREDSASGGGNVIVNYLRAQTGIRSVAPREGDDPDAILSRANAEVESGDIAGALDELAALPETARTAPAMAEWLDGAQAYRDAQAALTDLSAAKN